MPTANTELLKKRYDRLKATTERSNAESHWEDLATHILPNTLGFVGKRTPGERRMQKVLDSTGIHANELLAAGLHGLATNPASKWFSLRMTDEKLNEAQPVKEYLSEVEKRMWAAVYSPGTNFTTSLHECYLSMGCFGPAIMFVGERDNGGLLFQSRTLAECLVAENADGVVDTLMRKFSYTVRQVVQKSLSDGWKVSPEVQSNYDAQKFEDEVEIVHAVYPRSERDYGKDDSENLPYTDCYFEYKTGQRLHESGFHEFPFLVPRWSKLPGEVYGRSPGMTALPDIKMLQAMMLTIIKAAQKIADPPLFIPDDGVIGPVRTVPGGLNFYRGSREIFPLPTSNGLPLEFEMMEALRNRIRSTFYTDILQIVQDQKMTATEVMQRTQERMRLLGPMVGRLEAELLGPLVTRVFGIMHRMGLLPPAPEEIQEKDFTVEYVSPIATAQKQTEVHGPAQVGQFVMSLAGPEMGPQLLARRIHTDRAIDWAWDIFNCDPKLLKTQEEMDEDAKQEQAMKSAAALQQGGVPMADILNKSTGAMKNLSDANANDGTDMGQLITMALQNMQKNPRLLQNLQNASGQAGIPPEAVASGEPVELVQ